MRWCETKHFKKGLTNIPHHFKRIEYLMTPRLRVTIWIKRGGNLPSPLPMDLSNPEHASHTCASMHSSMHLIHAHHPSSMRISCISSMRIIHHPCASHASHPFISYMRTPYPQVLEGMAALGLEAIVLFCLHREMQ